MFRKSCYNSRLALYQEARSLLENRYQGAAARVLQTAKFSSTFQKSAKEIELDKLDQKWMQRWEVELSKKKKQGTERTAGFDSEQNEKFYVLSQFPYPSGTLHMGHLRVYTINDVLARYHRFKGHQVINPMGWDSFGLPAENAAIERNINPKTWTTTNISKMKHQLKRMLTTFDWERELSTCNQDYYKFTQLIFLWLYKHNLAYKNFKEINWDPVDQTVLANEQVDAQGKSWRSGALVEKKVLNQWFLKITEFADELNDDLAKLENWPTKVKMMQKNWIGKSKGANVKFKINEESSNAEVLSQIDDKYLEAFTSRPDTLFGVQYLAIAIDHPVTKVISESNPDLAKFIENAKEEEKKNLFSYTTNDLRAKSKGGFKLSEIAVENPITNSRSVIPVFVAPYVLSTYGSGAVMGCPGHDQRDWDFWTQNVPNVAPIKTVDPVIAEEGDLADQPYTGNTGKLNENCDEEYRGLDNQEAMKRIVSALEAKGMGHETTNFKIRDWLISRQRYWGCPIPIVYCDDCGMVPVPEDQLPVVLPENIQFTGKGNPLDAHDDFKKCKCPQCNKNATRETDTMDTFMDSSWYYFRYLDAKNQNLPFDSGIVNKQMPVDLYIGGVEHAILHLLYSRFLSKFLFKIGKWDGGSSRLNGEPFKRLVSQGMVHGKTFIHPKTYKFLKPEELDLSDVDKPKLKEIDSLTNIPFVPEITFEKMSKSKYNGVDPVQFIEKYGADATRAHILFQAPIELVLYWDENKISGVQRWLRKLYNMNMAITKKFAHAVPSEYRGKGLLVLLRYSEEYLKTHKFNDAEVKLYNEVQHYVGEMDRAFGKDLTLNTVISDYMKLTNSLSSQVSNKSVNINLLFNSYYKLLLMVSPVCPAISEEIWDSVQTTLQAGEWSSIFEQRWPQKLPAKESPNMEYSIMINGKFKFKHRGPKSLVSKPESQIIQEVLRSCDKEKDRILLAERQAKKVIVKPKAICFVY